MCPHVKCDACITIKKTGGEANRRDTKNANVCSYLAEMEFVEGSGSRPYDHAAMDFHISMHSYITSQSFKAQGIAKFDGSSARKIIVGAGLAGIPSGFESCGLAQLHSMLYR
ncbi:hypothetical protein VNO77_18752 [Canavalia gladiata]|uniref:Uncharacterized protein n=1 Tax=Canavalia gladiata TaxID=3824 RepID=A0AAN9LQA3_CANGL